jgi:hypothetical protein
MDADAPPLHFDKASLGDTRGLVSSMATIEVGPDYLAQGLPAPLEPDFIEGKHVGKCVAI